MLLKIGWSYSGLVRRHTYLFPVMLLLLLYSGFTAEDTSSTIMCSHMPAGILLLVEHYNFNERWILMYIATVTWFNFCFQFCFKWIGIWSVCFILLFYFIFNKILVENVEKKYSCFKRCDSSYYSHICSVKIVMSTCDLETVSLSYGWTNT